MSEKLAKPSITAAEAASLVHRMIAKVEQGRPVLDEHRNPVSVPQKIDAEEVMAFAEYDDRVVVVTKSGEKLTCEKSSEPWKAFAKGRK
jgi:hypothetical protein